jgi:hypothetical protein
VCILQCHLLIMCSVWILAAVIYSLILLFKGNDCTPKWKCICMGINHFGTCLVNDAPTLFHLSCNAILYYHAIKWYLKVPRDELVYWCYLNIKVVIITIICSFVVFVKWCLFCVRISLLHIFLHFFVHNRVSWMLLDFERLVQKQYCWGALRILPSHLWKRNLCLYLVHSFYTSESLLFV